MDFSPSTAIFGKVKFGKRKFFLRHPVDGGDNDDDKVEGGDNDDDQVDGGDNDDHKVGGGGNDNDQVDGVDIDDDQVGGVRGGRKHLDSTSFPFHLLMRILWFSV